MPKSVLGTKYRVVVFDFVPGKLGDHEHIMRRRVLIGSVRPAELLDGLVSTPGQLQRDVHAAPRVASQNVRVEGDASRRGVRDNPWAQQWVRSLMLLWCQLVDLLLGSSPTSFRPAWKSRHSCTLRVSVAQTSQHDRQHTAWVVLNLA
jgi:hypothetical protein